VDTAEDGAVAWDILQSKRYNLLITDNSMPKVTGVELIRKVRAAEMPIPVILATGTSPDHEFVGRPCATPNAILIKPYTITEFLGTVKNVLCAVISLMMLFSLSMAAYGQDNTSSHPTAVTLSAHGKCAYSMDGVNFSNLFRGVIFEQGTVIRTGDDSRADLFFRRTGTTVRLQAGTEMKIEKMAASVKNDLPVEDTLLDLRAGRIFTVVRSTVAGSTLEIRNAAGRAVVEGSGIGRYIITADGTHVTATGSVIPLKVIGENGITIIAAGQVFAKKEGKVLAASPSAYVNDLIELDQLQAIKDGVNPQ
jgi:CheY-like chemotaxis protein